jgi:hypothetical protein
MPHPRKTRKMIEEEPRTISAAHTYTGNVTFSGAPTFSGSPTFSQGLSATGATFNSATAPVPGSSGNGTSLYRVSLTSGFSGKYILCTSTTAKTSTHVIFDLPLAANTKAGTVFHIINHIDSLSSNGITINPTSADAIDSGTSNTQVISTTVAGIGASVSVFTDNAAWYTFNGTLGQGVQNTSADGAATSTVWAKTS